MTQAHQEAKDSITELRNVVRGVHPAVLTDRGLDAALSALAARSPVPCGSDVDVPRRPSPHRRGRRLLRGREALTNVAKHSGADARGRARRTRPATGCWSRSPTTATAAPSERAGSGLAGLRDRVAAVDGTFRLQQPADRRHHRSTVEVPCAS